MRHLSVLILIWVLLSCAESKTTKRDRFFFQGNEAIADRAWEKAIHYFDNAIRLDPEYALAYNNRGVVKVNQGRAA
ncbi:MAG: tetratricopeptide repeat protein, partial [Bacteroidota bacterium]